MRYIIGYLATALAFGLLDAVWLSQVGPKLYKPLLGDLLADKPSWTPAIIFYVIYTVGFFALTTARADSWGKAAVTGALFGLVAYATYDLTNQATLRHWSTTVTVADIAWGAFATGVAATLGWFAFRWAGATFR